MTIIILKIKDIVYSSKSFINEKISSKVSSSYYFIMSVYYYFLSNVSLILFSFLSSLLLSTFFLIKLKIEFDDSSLI